MTTPKVYAAGDPTPRLNEALLKAQTEMRTASKSKTNPHFKSKYADLDECWKVWMEVGPKNGLSITQGGGAGAPTNHLRLVTTLRHVSGECVESTFDIPFMKHDPQAFMAALTYGRRGGLCALTGIIADDDDDGNSATEPLPQSGRVSSVPAAKPAPRAAAPSSRPAAKPTSDMVFPNYGRAKGQRVAGASKQDLTFYLNGAKRTLADASKSRFHAQEQALVQAIEAELAMGQPQPDDGPPPHTDDDSQPF